MSVVLAIPDMHHPWSHKDTLPFLKALKQKYRPTRVVCLGDEADLHALSNYDHDPDGRSAGDELKAAVDALHPIYELFPEVSSCVSNHTARPFRRAKKYGIPLAFMRDYREFLQAPEGWWWDEQFEIDGVLYEHGEGASGVLGAIRTALGNMRSTVIGHLHSWAGISWAANPRHLVFGFNAGCLIDKDAYAFAYGKTLKNKPIIGAGIIRGGIPIFEPMRLNSRGRWTGEL
jgi:hypothetical protein